MGYIYTEEGQRKVECFINACKAKRKEILDTGKDTADETILPTLQDILDDINEMTGLDEDGTYFNCFGVTDHNNSDPLYLVEYTDIVPIASELPDGAVIKYAYTEKGKQIVDRYLKRLAEYRQKILDAEMDTSSSDIPTPENILNDINKSVGLDEDGVYFTCFGVTDHYNSSPVYLHGTYYRGLSVTDNIFMNMPLILHVGEDLVLVTVTDTEKDGGNA